MFGVNHFIAKSLLLLICDRSHRRYNVNSHVHCSGGLLLLNGGGGVLLALALLVLLATLLHGLVGHVTLSGLGDGGIILVDTDGGSDKDEGEDSSESHLCSC